MDLSTTIGGMKLECCIYNASGPRCGTDAALAKVAESASGAVVSKSATIGEQKGNPLPRTVERLEAVPGSINSEGLPNKGIDYYLDPKCVDAATSTGKPYIVRCARTTRQHQEASTRRPAPGGTWCRSLAFAAISTLPPSPPFAAITPSSYTL